jgi:hypothetical protein
MQRALLREKECVVRVYLIDAFGLQSRDIGSMSDPYAKASIGD